MTLVHTNETVFIHTLIYWVDMLPFWLVTIKLVLNGIALLSS